ncbi:hypothetical protein BB560_003267 [Smittium megazygosporum]|uniref:Uncharacterized protein n=1 Tax=Smittium megazygosporum TaxID=133381 RepID=A0A2T9ZCG6_9FUNG|nr:hypothetical protein BB560_003267 [Smittium megazygosporum]
MRNRPTHCTRIWQFLDRRSKLHLVLTIKTIGYSPSFPCLNKSVEPHCNIDIQRVQKTTDPAHEDVIWDIVWDSEKGRLISASLDESIKIWDEVDGSLLGVIKGLELAISSIDLAPSKDKLLATTMGQYLELWNLDDLSLLKRIPAGYMNSWKGKFINEGQNALTCTGNGTLLVWDLNSESTLTNPDSQFKPISTLDTTKNQFINSVSVDNSKNTAFAGSEDGNIYIFDVQTSQLTGEYTAHSDIVRDLKVDIKNDLVYSCSDDKRIIVYDSRYKNSVMTLRGHDDWVTCVDPSEDGILLLSCSTDSTVKLWDMRSRSVVQNYTKHSAEVWNVAWKNPDCLKFASAGEDSTILIYS